MTPAFVFSHPRYEPGAILGEGGQGTVLRITDREDPARELVAKVYRRGASTIPGEFALLSRNRLPGLVRAHDLAKDEITGRAFSGRGFRRWERRVGVARRRRARKSEAYDSCRSWRKSPRRWAHCTRSASSTAI